MAGRAVDVGTGYLTLAVETSGVAAGVGRAFSRVEGMGASTGRKTGAAFAKAFDSAKPVDISELTRKAEQDQAKLAQATQRSAKIRADAARKVQIEEMKLNELRDSGKAKASQLATAEDRVKAAREKYIDASRKGVGDIRAYAAAVDKSSSELKEAERAARGAGDSVDTASTKFGRLGGRIKSAMSGNFKGAFKGIEGDAARSANQVENRFDQAGKEAGRGFGNSFSGSLKGLAVAAVATMGLGQAARSVGDMIQGAGALEQSIGAVGSVFKENQGVILNWSNTSAQAVGLNKNEYNELATLIGAQLKNAGTAMEDLAPKTNDLIGLGADLSSMFGGSAKEAVEALSSALKGERDPIERYGVSLNQAKIDAEAAALGFEKVGNSFDQEAQSAATVSLIMKQTADAHGNFAKEADTFAGKQQRMVAEWDNLKMRVGEVFLPVMSNMIGFMGSKVLPVFNEAVGGIRAFGHSFMSGTGDITSSGFAGKMEEIGYQLRQVYDKGIAVRDWLASTSSKWGPFAAGIGLVIVAYKLWTAAVVIHEKALLAQARAFIIANAPIVAIITVIGLLVGALIYAYKNHEGFRNLVLSVWTAIRIAVSAVVGWFVGTAIPFIRTAIAVAGVAFNWLYNSVIKPVWTGIRVYIAVAIGVITTIFQAIVWVIRNTLGKAFTWLWQSIVRPVFDWIGAKIEWARGYVTSKFDILKRRLEILGAAFRFLWDRHVNPVWTWISDKITRVWNWVRDKALTPMMDWVENKVVRAFERAKDGVGKQWDKLRNIVRGPVDFFVNTVYNNGLRPNINKVLTLVGLEDKHLPEMNMPKGFARGGIVPGYQRRKVDDHLVPLRGGEGILVPEATRAIGKGFIDSVNHAANTGGVAGAAKALNNPAHMAVGSAVYGGERSFTNPLQHAIARTGRLKVSGAAPGWDLLGAIRMVDRATGIKVQKGSGGANSVHVTARSYPDWWAGYYQGQSIYLNNNAIGPGVGRRTVAAHELGHALGLPHSMPSGAQSIMNYNNMYAHNSMTQADVQALSRIYGGDGKAGGGGGFIDGLFDKINPVTKIVDGLFDRITGKFGKGLVPQLVAGIAKYFGKRVWDKITPQLMDSGGKLTPGLHAIENKTGTTEAILTAPQWETMMTIAENSADGGAGMVFTGDITTADPEEFFREADRRDRIRKALAR